MKKYKIVLMTLSLLLLFNLHALAGDIEQGTISVGASSNLSFFQLDSENNDDTESTLSLSTEMGYFFAKNWEIGAGLNSHYKYVGDNEYLSIIFSPFIGYHWNLNETSNLYARVGAGIGTGQTSGDGWESDSDLTTLFGEVGYEFFLTKNIALDLSFKAERFWSEYSFEDDDEWYWDEEDTGSTVNYITTQLKFKVYF